MAQKFGNFRWVKEGFLNGRTEGFVVGRIVFAGVGAVDFCLKGSMSGEIAGRVIRFSNSNYLDDPRAEEVLAEFEIPQIGTVSLISIDPHPLVQPHPYIEWFSMTSQHYRIELASEDAMILTHDQANELESESQTIRTNLMPLLQATPPPSSPEPEWF